MTCTKVEIVSSEAEALILVDDYDRELGTLDKSAAHDGSGVLHRAFSLFVFNAAGELLITQRAANKRLWPLYWSNSCCSHPRAGETMTLAVERRLQQELGLQARLDYVYRFKYQARYADLGSEHELCSVFVGRATSEPVINTTEVAAWEWLAPAVLQARLANHPERFTPWFKLEWQTLTDSHRAQLAEFTTSNSG